MFDTENISLSEWHRDGNKKRTANSFKEKEREQVENNERVRILSNWRQKRGKKNVDNLCSELS